MKNWTLESPGAGLVLHLVFFTLVVAAVRYSEHRAAQSPAPPTVASPPLSAAPAIPSGHTALPVLPLADAMAPRRPHP